MPSPHPPNPYPLPPGPLEQMRQAARRVLEYTAGLSFAEFAADARTQDAVHHNLHRFGVAAAALHKSQREEVAGLDWRSIQDLPRLVGRLHFGIQDEIIWDLIQRCLPRWLQVLEEALAPGRPREGL